MGSSEDSSLAGRVRWPARLRCTPADALAPTLALAHEEAPGS